MKSRAFGARPGRAGRLTAALPLLVGAALLLANLATLLGLLGGRWWLFELITHFTVQLAAVQALGLLALALWRRWRPVLLTLPFLLANLLPVGRYYLPTEAVAGGPSTLRVMTLNLYVRNDRIDLVEHAVRQEDPDVILFLEATTRWHGQLAALRRQYPHEIRRIVPYRHGMLLVSRIPFKQARILEIGAERRPVATATICPSAPSGETGDCLTLFGAHTERPGTAGRATARDDQLLRVAALAGQSDSGRTIMLGDFNTTPFSPIFPEVLRTGNLRDSALGFGVDPTWLSRFPLLGLAIDHILVGPGVRVIHRRVGADVGSDHFPVIADLAF